MLSESVEIKSKNQVVGSLEYEYPESFEEALEVDGEDKVFKLYMTQRKIRAIDAQRRALTGGGLPKALIAALKATDPAVLAKLAGDLGIDLS